MGLGEGQGPFSTTCRRKRLCFYASGAFYPRVCRNRYRLSTSLLANVLAVTLLTPWLWTRNAAANPVVVKHSMRKTSNTAGGRGIVAQAPCRADLAGGTIDLWPLYLFHPDAITLNFAVNILTTCRITPLKGRRIHLRSIDTRREEQFSSFETLRTTSRFRLPLAARLLQFFAPKEGLLIETDSESPAGAGISGSSALMIATTAALARFTGRNLTLEQMRVIAQNVEAQIIQVPTGCQDYYPALYGGVSAIHLDPDGIHREAVAVGFEEIESRFVLAYTGAPRQSGINNWEVFKAHIDGDKRVFRNFDRIVAIARSMHQNLLKSRWDEVARLLREEWRLRRTNAPGITTPLIDKLISVAARNGGLAAKACGAGGGGCVIFLVEDGAASRVATAIGDNGGRVLPLQVARNGLRLSSF
jgi:D-glycero-alpha-D-manno-heptose-7-phosphate kinase